MRRRRACLDGPLTPATQTPFRVRIPSEPRGHHAMNRIAAIVIASKFHCVYVSSAILSHLNIAVLHTSLSSFGPTYRDFGASSRPEAPGPTDRLRQCRCSIAYLRRPLSALLLLNPLHTSMLPGGNCVAQDIRAGSHSTGYRMQRGALAAATPL